MAYILFRFGTLTLPSLNTRYDLDTVSAKNTTVRTILSGFDTAGDGQADMDLPQQIRYQGEIIEDTLSEWRAAVDALRAVSRKRYKLWRKAWDDFEEQYCYARFISSKVQRGSGKGAVYVAELTFLQQTPWVGHDHRFWVLDDGFLLDDALYLDDEGYTFTLDASPYVATVNNGGNRTTNNIRLTITAGSANITFLIIACGDAELEFSGLISAGDVLVIDSGSQSVTNDGVADYANFTLTSNHTIEDWLVFEPGDNDLTITKTGGSTDSELLIEFQDGWE